MKNDFVTPLFIALIPAYKPLDLLPELVRSLREAGMRVVVVDDGSGEAYAPLFEACTAYADVCHHAQNGGKGRALKTGLSFIQEIYGEDCVIVIVDADGQHTVKDSLAVCREAAARPHALVIGSRKFTGKVPLRSRFGNTVTRAVYHLFSGVKVHDTQTGLRAFTGDRIATLLEIPGERYEYEMNMLLSFAKQKIAIYEHEIETIYENDNASSHFHPVRDSIRIYAQILKFSASSLIGFLVDYAMFGVFSFLTNHVVFSNVAARILSAAVNFTLNRKFVFKSQGGLLGAIVKYILLAVFILIGNTFCLHLLVERCALSPMLAKILVECFFFFLSWGVQKTFVFRKKGGKSK